jgi:hypothetical protein
MAPVSQAQLASNHSAPHPSKQLISVASPKAQKASSSPKVFITPYEQPETSHP